MPRRKVSALVAGALMFASTSAVAQTVPSAPARAAEQLSVGQVSELRGENAAVGLGVSFALLVIVLLIFANGNGPKSP